MTHRCPSCGESSPFTAPALSICAGGADIAESVNLSPSQELRCCMTGRCDSYFILVQKALLGFFGRPTRFRWARLVFADGHGVGLAIEGQKVALA